jgi:chemotaxis protein CheZ
MDSVTAVSPDPVSEKLQLAKSLVSHLEAGNDDDAGSVIAELTGFGDSLLFREIGRLTRELHDSINSFVLDARLANIAQHEMPDAAERLRYVISTTEQAANTTLGAVEESLPLADSLRNGALRLADQWDRFNSRQLSVDDFRELSVELSSFLTTTQANSETLHEKLSEVLMAQGYQDLTGQVIRKVIDLVNDVEAKLVELVRLSGSRVKPSEVGDSEKRDTSPQGPAVPGVDKNDVVSGQDDVDDLLSSLGF